MKTKDQFQTPNQLLALKVHSALERAFNWVTGPIVRFFDSNTHNFVQSGKPVKGWTKDEDEVVKFT